jgi:hypothetical protein
MISAKQLILRYLKENEIKQAWLARRMNTQPQYLWKKLNRQDVDSALITEISKALNHNFYADLSKAFEAEQAGVVPISEILKEPELKYMAVEDMLRKIVKQELQKQKSKE